MSTSAADYYKVVLAKQKESNAREQVEDASERLESIQNEVARLQESADTIEEFIESKRAVEAAAKQEIESAKVKASEIKKKAECVEIEPKTGLPVGERIPVTREEEEYVDKISEARQAVEDGDIEKARVLEGEASKIFARNDVMIQPRLLGLDRDAVQVSRTDFCESESIPPKKELDKTFAYARANPEKTNPGMNMYDTLTLFTAAKRIGTARIDYPKDVNPNILSKIFSQRKQLEECVKESRREEDDDSNAGEDEEEFTDDSEGFTMTEEAWDAVEAAIRNQIMHDREKNVKELTLPRKESATLARYNPNAHFAFQSDTAVASVAELDDALACCKLRNRPLDWSKTVDGSASKRSQQPFHYFTGGDFQDFDIDGDLMAMCGDLHYNQIYGSKPYVACGTVPCPTNLEHAETMGDLKDKITGDFGPWDDRFSKFLNKKRSEYFTHCFAHAETKCVWASSSTSGTIHGFSSAPGLSRSERPIGLLAFDKVEVAKQKSFVNGSFNIVRCGNHVVGSGGTGRLSFWNMKDATDEFPGVVPTKSNRTERNDDLDDATSSSEEESVEEGEPAPKRQKVEAYKGLFPKIVTVEENNFSIGDIQWVKGSQILVGPSRDFKKSSQSGAIRMFDIASESIVGLFSGGQSDVCIGRQHCIESNLVFSSETTGTVYAWDTRTCRPAIMLHTYDEDVLGIPGDSGIFAFTYGRSMSESISCWDLRMPASHAYTMATGNSNVTSLHWHAQTSSLLAATNSKHQVIHGRYRSYIYGDDISGDEQDELDSYSYWPRAAKHERNYFGPCDWHCDTGRSPVILQYAFDNGRPMGAF